MANGPYSFIDIVVLDEVRTRFAAGDALAILTIDLEEVIWANGPGATLLGHSDIETVMGASPDLGTAGRRQISATTGFPRMGRDRPVAVRLASGITSRVVTLLVSSITLPDGEPAVLIAAPAQTVSAWDEIARRTIDGFGEAGYFAALVDAEGRILAASEGFDGLGIEPATLSGLVEEVAGEDDRLVKRLIPAGATRLPAGFARLTDEPALHLLIAVDEPADKPVQATGFDDDAAIPSDADLPERVEEDGELDSGQPPALRDEEATAGEAPASTVAAERRPAAAGPIRFVWRTDADGAFSAISPEFTAAVGSAAADVIGRRFRDVAAWLGLDPQDEIAGLLERRDTWSGRTVPWPIADTDLAVPVDLAALPVYGRDRDFQGFRGFGVARMADAVTDPDARGLHLGAAAQTAPAGPGAQDDAVPQPVQTEESAAPAKDTQTQPDGDPFRGEVPVISIAEQRERRQSDKVIRLAEHRTPAVAPGRQLSAMERSAFEEIRARLRKDYEADQHSEQVATNPEADDAVDTPDAGSADMPGEDTGASVPDRAEAPAEVSDEHYDEPHLAELDEAGRLEPIADGEEAAAGPAEAKESPSSEDLGNDGPLPSDGETASGVEPEAEDARADAFPQTAAVDDLSPVPPAPVVAASGFVPSAFSTDNDKTDADAELIAGLPFPLLVHAGDDLYHANREFLALTGYASLDQIRREGGLDRLFVEGDPQGASGSAARKLHVRTLGGETFPVDAHLQSIRWRAGSALLLSLQRIDAPSPPRVEAPVRPVAADAGVSELEARVAEMRTIIDTATDGVVLIASDGTIRDISRPAEALFGFDSAQVEGEPFVSLFAIESQRAARDYLNGLADNGVASVLNDGREVIGREAAGRFIPLFMTIGKLPGDSGYCAVVRDITQWKRAEEDLTQARSHAERASSQKTEFLARVSHEIRTPLNAIIGFSELMMDEKFGPIGSDRYRDYLRDINRSGNHVLDLVNDLLDISKIEAGEQEMNYEAVSLNETLAESVAMMQPQANRDRVIIRSSLASRLPEVVADLRSVRQIALNLLSNAIRYTQAGGQVIVSTAYEPSGDVMMRVRDTGVGMSIGEIDQALKPFKQINALKRGRRDGTGLGLPLTKAMVEANRALFSISSNPGQGTMVEITFPSTRVLAD